MKYLVMLLVICGLAFTYAQVEEVTKKVHKIADDCKEETGATDADVDAMFKHQPAVTDKAKCLSACVLKKMNVVNADNKLDRDAAIAFLKSVSGDDDAYVKLGTEIVDECKDRPAVGDSCEASEAVRTCVIEKSKEKDFQLPF